MVEGKTVRPPSFSSSAAIVLDHPAAVPAAAQEWADRYESSRARATAEMLTLLVRAAGAPDDGVTPGEVEDGDVDALVARLVTAVTTDGVADPFKRRGGKAAKGRTGRSGARRSRRWPAARSSETRTLWTRRRPCCWG